MTWVRGMEKHTRVSTVEPPTMARTPERAETERLLFALLEGKDIAQILDVAASLLGNPPSVINSISAVCAPGRRDIAGASFLDMLRDAPASEREIFQFVSKSELMDQAARAERPLLIDCAYLGVRALVGCIRAGGETVASLFLPESERPFGEHDAYYVGAICRYISAGLDAGSIVGYIFERISGKKLHGMLAAELPGGVPGNWPGLRAGGNQRSFFMVAARPGGDAEGVCRLLETRLCFCCATPFQDTVAALCYTPERGERDFIMSSLCGLAQERGLWLAVSESFESPADVKSRYEQAARILEAAETLYPACGVYAYEDCFVDALLFEASRYVYLMQYVDDGLLRLRQTDRRYRSHLYETLTCWLGCAGDSTVACARLGLHRNTLAQRLRRMEELLERPLHDGDYQARLLLSVKILRIQERLEDSAWETWR